MAPLIICDHVERSYAMGEAKVAALNDVSFEMPAGAFWALMGPSGSGKSTLLNVIGGLDRPTAGRIIVDGDEIEKLSANALARYRREKVGFIFQSFNLLPRYTVAENVALPLIFAGVDRKTREQRAKEWLERLGLGNRLKHRPTQLSGGEQQRVAVARALVVNPRILLADEPTGNLDSANSAQIVALLKQFHQEQGQTILMVTHNPEVAEAAERTLRMRDGRILDMAESPRAVRPAAASREGGAR